LLSFAVGYIAESVMDKTKAALKNEGRLARWFLLLVFSGAQCAEAAKPQKEN